MGSQIGDFCDDPVNGKQSNYDESLNYANLFDYKDQSQDLSSLNLPTPSPDPNQYNLGSFSKPSPGVESSDDSDDSDNVLKYIREILMEEDMEQKPCMFHDSLALQAAERPFYDALGTTYPHSPNQHPLCLDSSDTRSWNSLDPKTPVESTLYESGFGSNFGVPVLANVFSEQESIMQFQRGMEEASKFLPKNNNIVIDLESYNLDVRDETRGASTTAGVKKEKIHYREEKDDEFDEGRSSKQSAVSTEEEAELSEMFDRVLLCPPITHEAEKGHVSNPVKDRPKKQDSSNNGKKSKNTVDLRSLLILCAQSTASDDRRTSDELLKQIRDNSSPDGDGCQRLAHYFANALEARLAGVGPQIYTALSTKRTSAADMIKAYQFFIRTSPFKKIFIGFANHTILKAAEHKSKLHIIDFGILYGFQWPLLIQRLSERPGGPPKLCITGIDLPQPGFRPAERVETTGRRLQKYCERFKVPFEYHAIAQKWETIKLEDLKIVDDGGIVAVNSLFRFKNLLDETIVVDSPRNAVLNLIRRINPDIFVHGVINGSYNAPFFVTRFREALFHYSTLFDMFDANATRDDPERFMFEKEFYGREIMNVVACEGTERVERPETYKQWQVRNNRVGFRQLRLDPELMGNLRWKVKESYHKDFVIDVDGHWALLGWKGRICYAISAWVPT